MSRRPDILDELGIREEDLGPLMRDEPTPEALRCPNCFAVNRRGRAKCANCGYPLKAKKPSKPSGSKPSRREAVLGRSSSGTRGDVDAPNAAVESLTERESLMEEFRRRWQAADERRVESRERLVEEIAGKVMEAARGPSEPGRAPHDAAPRSARGDEARRGAVGGRGLVEPAGWDADLGGAASAGARREASQRRGLARRRARRGAGSGFDLGGGEREHERVA